MLILLMRPQNPCVKVNVALADQASINVVIFSKEENKMVPPYPLQCSAVE